MNYINVTEFRNNISKYMNEIFFYNKKFTILKCGKEIAIITPPEKDKKNDKKHT